VLPLVVCKAEAQDSFPPPTDGTSVTKGGQESTSAKEDKSSERPKFFIPVRVEQDQKEYDRAKEREEVSDRREQLNLEAQESIAEYTRLMVDISQRQLCLAFFGSVALIISLCFTVLSLRQTRQAMTDTKEIGVSQTRAYICIESAEFKKPVAGMPIQASVKFKNTGLSPAYDVSGWCRIVAGKKAFAAARKDGKGILVQFGNIGGDVERSFPHPPESINKYDHKIENHISKGGFIYVFGEISYRVSFRSENEKRKTQFRYFYRYNSRDPDYYAMLADVEGNNST
ncbi:MAG: hypothetical protein H5U11_04270, partial [Rhizobium sp.]|nr:hypothetical protein [Rhizobium sp.]